MCIRNIGCRLASNYPSRSVRAAELRAATSLHRLLRTAESRAILADGFGRYTEGLDLPDLVAARTLLDG